LWKRKINSLPFLVLLLARWQTQNGKHWLELYRDGDSYYYRGDDCGGVLGRLPGTEVAIAKIEAGAVSCLKSDFPSTKKVK
jgi:hypothetical protein